MPTKTGAPSDPVTRRRTVPSRPSPKAQSSGAEPRSIFCDVIAKVGDWRRSVDVVQVPVRIALRAVRPAEHPAPGEEAERDQHEQSPEGQQQDPADPDALVGGGVLHRAHVSLQSIAADIAAPAPWWRVPRGVASRQARVPVAGNPHSAAAGRGGARRRTVGYGRRSSMASDDQVPAGVSPAPSSLGLDGRRLRLLLEIGQSVVSELDLEVVLTKVLAAARELTGARYAAVGVMAPDRRSLERFVTSGIDSETQMRIGELPRGRGILGYLIDEPRPLRLADVGSHPRSYGFPLGHPPMSTFLGVPVIVRGRAWGNLYLTEKETGEFDEQDEAAIVVLAAWAAKAIDNARLYQAEQTRRDALERTVRALETTTDIARAIGGETQLERVLELIVKRGRALVEAESMVLLLQDGDELVVTAVAGAVDPDVVGQRVPIEGSETGSVLGSGGRAALGRQARLRFGLGERIAATPGCSCRCCSTAGRWACSGRFDRLTGGPGFTARTSG